jgi:hypothetical protein
MSRKRMRMTMPIPFFGEEIGMKTFYHICDDIRAIKICIRSAGNTMNSKSLLQTSRTRHVVNLISNSDGALHDRIEDVSLEFGQKNRNESMVRRGGEKCIARATVALVSIVKTTGAQPPVKKWMQALKITVHVETPKSVEQLDAKQVTQQRGILMNRKSSSCLHSGQKSRQVFVAPETVFPIRVVLFPAIHVRKKCLGYVSVAQPELMNNARIGFHISMADSGFKWNGL